jgi:hypothetical protein
VPYRQVLSTVFLINFPKHQIPQEGTYDADCNCQPTIQPSAEVCDGVDNDCGGVTDEGCSCDYNGLTQGVCFGAGTISASTGNCAVPDYYEHTETACDWLDNDCDGEIDEGCLAQ